MNKKLLLTAAFIFAFLFCGVTGARYYVIGEQTEPLTPNKIIRALKNPKRSHNPMHTFCSANTLPVPLLGNSRDRFNAFSSIVFYVCMFEHLYETFKR